MKNKILFILAGILLLAAVLRFYKLGQIPVSLYWDEAAVGYNAYSIATNLKDEHGTFMPLMFKSFGEYKMPAYVYMSAPIVKVFGLNEFSVRFWSATFGVLAVLGSYLLTKTLLTVVSSKKIKETRIETISLLTAFLMATSMWHIQFSRTGFEANGLLTFIIFGFWLFLKGLENKKYLLFAAIVLGVSMYFYRGVIAFLPFMLGVSIILFYKKLISKSFLKTSISSLIIFIIISVPITQELFSSRGLERTNEVSILNLQNNQSVDEVLSFQATHNIPLGNIFLNRRVGFGVDFIIGYISHLSPQYLFIQGDTNPRHNGSNNGVLYMWSLPFILFGLFLLWKTQKKIAIFVTAWILFAPIPAALSVPIPHALRSLNMLPMPELLMAIGMISFVFFFSKKYRKLVIGVIALVIVLSVFQYLRYYYTVWPAHSAESWGDGHKQMIEYIKNNQQDYEKVLISGHYWQPYIYTLFYTRYDPVLFQELGSKKQFGPYLFGGTSWDREQYSLELDGVVLKEFSGSPDTLVVLSPPEYEKQKVNVLKLKEIRNKNNEVVFIISKTL